MRKIEKAMCYAAGHNVKWKSGNTAVVPIDEVNCAVYLHGNEIAVFNSATGRAFVNWVTFKHWPTRTTKSRLRALGASLV